MSDDESFQSNIQCLTNDQTLSNDVMNPGLAAVTIDAPNDGWFEGRYVRMTATKLAKRANDYHFALAELQVVDAEGKNLAAQCEVSAKDSIEAPPRWRKSNLTDGIFPESTSDATVEAWEEERETRLLEKGDLDAIKRRAECKKRLAEVDEQLKKLPSPDLVYAGGVHTGSGNFIGTGASGGRPRPIHLLARGQVSQPVREVEPGAIAAFSFRPSPFSLQNVEDEGERRVALAQWITDRDNPFTWRSIVNRVWLYHFGKGLVDTPNDFGHNGSKPSHPELLDWLAVEFRDSGGSLKQLHRRIVSSETYRQSSAHHDAADRIDSGNTLLWRQNRRRLEAEAIRDSVLFVSGKLDLSMGGPGWQDFVIEHPSIRPIMNTLWPIQKTRKPGDDPSTALSFDHKLSPG